MTLSRTYITRPEVNTKTFNVENRALSVWKKMMKVLSTAVHDYWYVMVQYVFCGSGFI